MLQCAKDNLREVWIICAQHHAGDPRVSHKIGTSLVANGMRVRWIGPEFGGKGTLEGITFDYFAAKKSTLWERLNRKRRLRNKCFELIHEFEMGVVIAVEPDSAFVASQLARRCNARAIFDIHEVYHRDALVDRIPRWLHGAVSPIVLSYMRHACRRMDLLIGPGRSRIDPYRRREQESLIIRHCLGKEVIERNCGAPFLAGRKCYRVMHGKANASKGTMEVIRATALAAKMLPDGVELCLVCFDDFGINDKDERSAFYELVRREGLEGQVELRSMVSFTEMLEILVHCDIGLIAYGRECGVNCVPNRLFEYMAVGLPAIVPSFAIELKPIIEEFRCGLAVDTENPEAIANAIVWLVGNQEEARSMGNAGRLVSRESLNMEAEIEPLIRWIRNAMRSSGEKSIGRIK